MKFFIFIFLIFSMKTFAHHPGHKIEANKPYPSVSLEILEDNMDGYNLYIKLKKIKINTYWHIHYAQTSSWYRS